MANPKIRFKKEDGTEYSDWENYIKLGDCSEFITKGATPTTYGFQWQSQGIPFFRNDAIKDNKFVYGDYSFISEEANDVLSRSEIQGGDLLIAITGDIGKVGIVPDEIKRGNINQHIAKVRIKQDVYSYFAYQYLCTTKVQKEYKKIKTGLFMPQLSLEQVRNTLIPRISLEEQKKIADFLSDIDKIIKQSEAELKNLETQKKGVMQKIFSQEVKFKREDGSDYPEWKISIVGEEFEFFNGVAHENDVVDIGEFVIINSKFISTEGMIKKYTNSARFPLLVDDIVMVMSDIPNGKAIAKCYLVEKNNRYTLNQRICCLRTKHNKIFMVNQISRNRYFLKFDDGVKQTNLRKEDILNCPIVIPCYEEQQRIAEIFSTFDEVISSAKQELEKWKELKKGLLQQMFV